MAIQFARCQIVKRSEGGNACRSASYNGRSQVKDERTGNVYYFSDRVDNAHHEIMLPKGADEKFRDSSYLWNAVEKAEKRLDAQVAKELVLALPDDKNIDTKFRIEFAQRFVKENFVDKGLAAQIDIHAPHGEKENNWHAHILVTTRRFSDCGTQLNRLKARDLNGTFYKGKVMEGDLWGEISRDLQNKMFEEKGLPNRVDPLGIVPQEHLGPVRMRNIENDALQRAEIIKEANEEASKDPEIVLDHLMDKQSVFNEGTLDWFLKKHVLEEDRAGVKESIMGHKGLVPLYDRESGEKTGFYTTKPVRSEEEKLVRFAESIDKSHSKTSIVQQLVAQSNVPEKQLLKDLTKDYSLTKGQRAAFESVVGEKRGLHIIRGRAGVGKSYVLSPIAEAYQKAGYQVVGLAPTHKASNNLQGSGFDITMTAHRFVFAAHNNKITLPSKSLVVVDEAGMIGTEHFVELMNVIKQSGSKVLLGGDEHQLASIQRGDMFEELAQRHGSVLIDEIKRQQDGWQKDVARSLADGRFESAVRVLDQEGKIYWNQDKNGSKAGLMEDWAQDVRRSIGQGQENKMRVENRFILATRNSDVDSLNIAARDLMKEWGLVESQDYEIRNDRGIYLFAAGDHIQFGRSDKNLGIVNGWTGQIKALNEKEITIKLSGGKELTFDPGEYQGLRYGYAGTVYKSQGATLDKTYILHDRIGDAKNSYVALTRFAKDIGIYANKDETKSLDQYIAQISREDGRGASLRYATLEEVQRASKDLTLKDKVVGTLKDVKTKIGDSLHSNKDFYDLGQKPENTRHEVVKINDLERNPAKTEDIQLEDLSKKSNTIAEHKKQQELDDGNKTHNSTAYTGSPSREKSELEEEGLDFNQREDIKTTPQDDSQGAPEDQSVEGPSPSSSDFKFDIGAWEAEMARKYPEEVKNLQRSLQDFEQPLSSDPIEFESLQKVSTGDTLNEDKESYSFIKELEEKYPEETKRIRESIRDTEPDMNLDSRLREVHEIMGREKDRSYYEEQLGIKLEQHMKCFKNNFKDFRGIEVEDGLKSLHKELVEKFKPEAFEKEISRMSSQELCERLLNYKHTIETTKDREHLEAKEDFKCFLDVARENNLKKLQKACDSDQNSKDLVYKTLGIEQNQPQEEKSRGFER